MRVGVLGAGAIGGVIAARLAMAGHHTAVVARGAHLAAIEARGLRLREEGRDRCVDVTPVADAADLGELDILFLSVKAHDLEAATARLDPRLLARAVIVPVLNGIPWWYRPPGSASPLGAIDPSRTLSQRFAASELVAAVAHFAADVPEAGVVKQVSEGSLLLGRAAGDAGQADRVRAAFRDQGFDVRVAEDIVREVWVKLVGNVAFNPVSALTGATMSEICANAALINVVRSAMGECMNVGASCGVSFPLSIDERIDMARAIGGAKLSMLQDIEKGRQIEAGAVLGAVSEIGRTNAVPTPTIDMLQALVSERAARNHQRRQI